jgi:hypothetical protein
MSELIEITRALELVKEFNPLQRVLLTCAGTLQGTLSAFFGQEIGVRVIMQEESGGELIRAAQLHTPQLIVCTANSQLTVTRPDVLEKVLSQEIGIGQVLAVLDVRPAFDLLEVGQDASNFWRTYRLAAPGVVYRISESFSQALYREWR